jgi:hypothetical protein
MSITDKLAISLGRRDDVPNQELAKELVESEDKKDIEELVENLNNKDNNIQSDCIKVLYEIGYLDPELIAGYTDIFIHLLRSKNNRLVWGGMIALSAIAEVRPDVLFEQRDEIIRAIDHGSVITVDRGIQTLAIVASKDDAYRKELFPYLLNHLTTCRPKDVAQHAEKTLVAVDMDNKRKFMEVLETRMEDLKPSQEKRVKKTIFQAKER